MRRIQAFVFFFLLDLNIPKAKSSCSLDKSKEHCVCSLLERPEAQTFFTCLPATTYELQGGNLAQFAGFSGIQLKPEIIDILEALQVSKLIFTDLTVPEVLLPIALKVVSYAPQVSELEFVKCTFLRSADQIDTDGFNLKISSLRFHKVTAAPLDDRLDISSLKGWLETLENLTVTESQVTSVPCKISTALRGLRLLDLSGNLLQDQVIETSFCKGAFLQLQILKLHRNNLTSYETVCQRLAHLSQLIHLDLSQNDFLPGPLSSPCSWPPSLRIFNLSNTGLKHMDRSLPPAIEILDLSANHLFTLDLSIPELKELYLSNNQLQTISFVKGFPGLEVLSFDHNQLPQLPAKLLQSLEHLQSLKAGRNLYNCSCQQPIREIQDLATGRVLLPDWPHDYICRSPPDYQDYLLTEVPLLSLQCNSAAMIGQTSIVSLITRLHLVLGLASLAVYGNQLLVV